MLRTLLIISLSLNVFVFASLAMYGTWIVVSGFVSSTLWRGIVSLFVWIVSFGAGAVAFWRVIDKFSSSLEAGVLR